MVRVFWGVGRSAAASALKLGAVAAPVVGPANTVFALALDTPVPPFPAATIPVTLAALPAMLPVTCPPPMLPVIVPATVAVDAFPVVLTLMVAGKNSVTAPEVALMLT